jgi:transposase-like protein
LGVKNRGLFDLKGTQKEIDEIKDILKQGGISNCKYCKSTKIVKYGHYHNIQRWLCKDCGRKFADNKAKFGLRTQSDQIATVLTMFHEGTPVKEILRHLAEVQHAYPSSSTLHTWVKRVTEAAQEAEKKLQPEVSDHWIADESTLNIGTQKVFIMDVVDVQTGFLLSSQLAYSHSADEAQNLLNKAVKRAGKAPEIVLSNQLAAFLDNFEINFGRKTRRIKARKPESVFEAGLIEHYHSVLNIRVKILRRFKSLKNSEFMVTGWPVHYNYFRPHEQMHSNTPAAKAGIKTPLKI